MFHMSVRVCFVSWIEYVSYVGESMFCILDSVFHMSVSVFSFGWSVFCMSLIICFVCQ